MIRPMRPDEAAAAADIAASSMPQPWSRTAFAQEIANPQAILLAAFSASPPDVSIPGMATTGDAGEGKKSVLCGYIALQLTPDDAELTGIAVSAAYRRRGIASALLKAAREALAAQGIDQMVLEVRASNVPAIAFYETHGFICIGVRRGFYASPREDALVMTDKKEECND